MIKLKKILPDFVALLLLLAVAVFLFRPILEGKALHKGDKIHYAGMAKEIVDYRAETGKEILWSNNMFSGMPTYMRNNRLYKESSLTTYLNFSILGLLPSMLNLLFVALVSFYVLARSMSVSRWLSSIGAVLFGFSNFILISLEAGHTSKIGALGFAPLILAGVIMIFKQKKILGLIVLALGLGMQLGMNHLQITYYSFLLVSIFMIYQLIAHVKAKNLAQITSPLLYSICGALLGMGMNFNLLYTNYHHSKETIRGGVSELAQELASEKSETASTGLDYEYATGWSLEIGESLSMLIPSFKGGGSSEDWSANSDLKASGLPERALEGIPAYWGDMSFTSGPMYIGAIAFFLFLFYIIASKDKFRWMLLSAFAFFLFLSWGKYSFLFDFLFDNLPFFNKFRVPSMATLMISMLVALGAVLGLHHILNRKHENQWEKPLLYSLYGLGGLVVLAGFLLSGSYSFEAPIDARYEEMGWPMRLIREARASMLSSDSWRSLILILLAFGAMYFFGKDKIKKPVFLAVITALVLFDMLGVGTRYITTSDFSAQTVKKSSYKARPVDQQIASDKDLYFRVYDTTTNAFSDARLPYFHSSIGGYSAVKLNLYQDLIENQFAKGNKATLDMLNVKYFIGQANGAYQVQENTETMGNAWAVSDVLSAASAREEMEMLNTFRPAKNAIVRDAIIKEMPDFSKGPVANTKIDLSAYHPEKLTYNAHIEGGNRLVVFSEVYYNTGHDDWKLYVDGKETDIYRVNYALRGAVIPEGDHQLEMVFEPYIFLMSATVSKVFSMIFLLTVLGLIFYKRKQQTVAA